MCTILKIRSWMWSHFENNLFDTKLKTWSFLLCSQKTTKPEVKNVESSIAHSTQTAWSKKMSLNSLKFPENGVQDRVFIYLFHLAKKCFEGQNLLTCMLECTSFGIRAIECDLKLFLRMLYIVEHPL